MSSRSFIFAEMVGFEPTKHQQFSRFRNECISPLCHISMCSYMIYVIVILCQVKQQKINKKEGAIIK